MQRLVFDKTTAKTKLIGFCYFLSFCVEDFVDLVIGGEKLGLPRAPTIHAGVKEMRQVFFGIFCLALTGFVISTGLQMFGIHGVNIY